MQADGSLRSDLDRGYADASNLDARAALYARYRPPEDDFKAWVFRRLPRAPRARVLDVGCGPGAIWSENAARIPPGWHLTLLDRSAGMLRDARDRLAPSVRTFDLVRADVEDLPFGPGSFDVVTAFHMLYDVPDLDRGLAEIRRILAPAGVLCATTNGAAQHRELREALRRAGCEGEFVGTPWHGRFDLRGGPEALRRHFGDVETFRMKRSLDVTEVEPLVAYALSIDHLRLELGEARLAAFREAVAAEISRRGRFRVTTHAGLLVATGKGGP